MVIHLFFGDIICSGLDKIPNHGPIIVTGIVFSVSRGKPANASARAPGNHKCAFRIAPQG